MKTIENDQGVQWKWACKFFPGKKGSPPQRNIAQEKLNSPGYYFISSKDDGMVLAFRKVIDLDEVMPKQDCYWVVDENLLEMLDKKLAENLGYDEQN